MNNESIKTGNPPTTTFRKCYKLSGDSPARALGLIVQNDWSPLRDYETPMENLKTGDLFILVEPVGSELAHASLLGGRIEDGHTVYRATSEGTITGKVPGVECIPVLRIDGQRAFYTRRAEFDATNHEDLKQIIEAVS